MCFNLILYSTPARNALILLNDDAVTRKMPVYKSEH
jgi:hypothetical protein